MSEQQQICYLLGQLYIARSIIKDHEGKAQTEQLKKRFSYIYRNIEKLCIEIESNIKEAK